MKTLATTLTFAVAMTAAADVITVDDSGGADYTSIQAAIDASSDGDEIQVQPGTYTGSGDNVVNLLGKRVWLNAMSGGNLTPVIDGQNARTCVVCNSGETSETIIQGFRIINGAGAWGQWGGGARCWDNSNPTFINCEFRDNNSSVEGGAVYVITSSPSFQNCAFTNNSSASDGGGMYLFNSSTFTTLTRCTFTGNFASGEGGGLANLKACATLVDCRFTGNDSSGFYGSTIWSSDGCSPYLEGCTVCGNTENSSSQQVYPTFTDGGDNSITSSCVTVYTVDDDGPADFDNIQAAFNFADRNGSYGADIVVAPGTYEGVIVPTDDTNVYTLRTGGGPTDPAPVITGWYGLYIADNQPVGLTVEGIEFNGNRTASVESWSADYKILMKKTFKYCEFRNSWRNVLIKSGNGDWTFKHCEFRDNHHGLGLGGGTAIQSGWDDSPEEANYHQPIFLKVVNCSFINNFSGGDGGAIHNSGYAELIDCTFIGNSADPLYCCTEGGGGIYNSGSATLLNCRFEGNMADDGGGMYNSIGAIATLVDCTFVGNTVYTDPSWELWNRGGGLFAYGDVALWNCVFEENVARTGGGGIYSHEDPSYSNLLINGTRVCGNLPDQILGAWTDNGQNDVSNSCPGGDPGAGFLPDCTCLDGVTGYDIEQLGGIFAGEGTLCSSTTCPIPDNMTCEDAIDVGLGSTPFDSTYALGSGLPADDAFCVGTDLRDFYRDLWFRYTAENEGVHHFTTCDPASFDTDLMLYVDIDCASLFPLACNGNSGDSACQQNSSALDYYLMAGQSVLVRVGGSDVLSNGPGTLTIECNDCVPAEDNCPADINNDGEVNGVDLATVLGAWGPCQ